MSSRNNRRPPVPDDQYFTPKWIVDLAVRHVAPTVMRTRSLKWSHRPQVLDPGAGQGAFAWAACEQGAEVLAVEKQITMPMSRRYPEIVKQAWSGDAFKGKHRFLLGHDFLTMSFADRVGSQQTEYPPVIRKAFDLALGNPPYSLAEEFVRASLACSEQVIFLLRLAFLASEKRSTFFDEWRPTSVWVIPQRPAFGVPMSYEAEHGEVNRNDSADYAFFCWDRKRPRAWTDLKWLPLVDDRERG